MFSSLILVSLPVLRSFILTSEFLISSSPAKITQGEQFELNANGTDVSTMVIWEIEP